VFLAGKSPSIQPYTVYIYGHGQPYTYHTHTHTHTERCSHMTVILSLTSHRDAGLHLSSPTSTYLTHTHTHAHTHTHTHIHTQMLPCYLFILALTSHVTRVGQIYIYTVYIRCFWQGNHQIYGVYIRIYIYGSGQPYI